MNGTESLVSCMTNRCTYRMLFSCAKDRNAKKLVGERRKTKLAENHFIKNNQLCFN